MDKPRLIVVSCFYNCTQFIESWFESITAQDYDNFYVLAADDASTDDTYSRIIQKKCENILVRRNEQRMGYMYNLTCGLSHFDFILRDEDVLVVLDGDDQFHGNALGTLAKIYEDESVWLTYGSFRRTNNLPCHCRPIPDNNVRYRPFVMSHPRTYKWFLFRSIPKSYLINPETRTFWNCAADRVTTNAMAEMAGVEHIRFIPEILYVYNTENPLCINNRKDLYAKVLPLIERQPKLTIMQKAGLLSTAGDWV